jgi:hypothetical protein
MPSNCQSHNTISMLKSCFSSKKLSASKPVGKANNCVLSTLSTIWLSKPISISLSSITTMLNTLIIMFYSPSFCEYMMVVNRDPEIYFFSRLKYKGDLSEDYWSGLLFLISISILKVRFAPTHIKQIGCYLACEEQRLN